MKKEFPWAVWAWVIQNSKFVSMKLHVGPRAPSAFDSSLIRKTDINKIK